MLPQGQRYSFSAPRGFIAIEGLNGAGKSTLQRGIIEYLNRRGIEATATREPGATPLGIRLRDILLNTSTEKICALAELFLFSADRAEHVAKIIAPAIARGAAVVTDRYFYSTAAFQGGGRELSAALVEQVNALAISGMLPDLVIVLDIDPLAGLKRNRDTATAASARARDAFEEEALEFHGRIRAAFLQMAQSRPEPFLVIDAAQPADKVLAEATAVLTLWADAFLARRISA